MDDFKSEKVREFNKIAWKTDYLTQEVGNPELPLYRATYVLPIDVLVTSVTFTTQTKKKHEQNFNIIPVQQPIPTDNSIGHRFTQPNSAIYQSNSPYPNKLYEIESDGFYMGYHLITLRIYPFEYYPLTQTLNYYSQLEFTINYSFVSNKDNIYPLTQSLYRAEQCKNNVRSLVKNPDDVERFGSNVQTIRNGKTIIQNLKSTTKSSAPQKTKTLSVLDEQIPDYIIITNNALKPSFQILADWKTKKGIFTIIKTTEDIASEYLGNDLLEKIRNYLIECNSKWGQGLFILLGGDKNIIPSRLVMGVSDGLLYPTDKYFSTSSTWTYSNNNFNGNNNSDVFNVVGRVPFSSSNEVSTFITKLVNYEKAQNIDNLNYIKNNLYADAYLEYDSNGNLCNFFNSYLKSMVHNNVPTTINNVFMSDNADCSGTSTRYTSSGSDCSNGNHNGDIEFNRNNFLNCLSSGSNFANGKFHFIFHLDHSGQDGMGTSSKDKGQGVSNQDFNNLSNGNSYQVLFSGGCHPANFQYDCIGKHYLSNSNGGVAFIGNTDVGWQNEYSQLNGFLSSLYKYGKYNIGSIAQYVLLNNSSSQSWRLHLLGDPEMPIWTDVPINMNVSLSTTAVTLGSQTVNVAVSGLPSGTSARICFWKGTEVYVIQENVINGTYPISFTANTTGNIMVTVTAHNFKPYENLITVNQTTNPSLSVATVDFGDGIVQGFGNGNANGKNDAGETINLTMGIKNNGVNTANNVTATLTCSSPYITITSSQGSFGNIASGVTATSNQFNYIIRKDAPGKDANGIARPECLANDKNPISFTAAIHDVTNSTWTYQYNIDVYKDSLVQCNKIIVSTTDNDLIPEAGETVIMNIALQNLGKAPTKGLTAILTSNNGNCTINSGNAVYSTIAPLEIKNGNATFSFNTSTSSLDQIAFNLQVMNAYGKTWNFPFTLTQPTTITASSIDFSASETEIDLTWNVVNGVSGYNIYRCDVDAATGIPNGNYVKLNSTPFQFSYYNDLGLQKTTKYSYKLTTVSSTGNESDGISKIVWTSYPSKNLYPRQMDQTIGTFHTPINVGDVNNDGKKEIFAGIHGGTYNGGLVCLDYYGNEPFNIDNNVTTYSGFAQLGYDTWAIPAIGDLNKTGSTSIVEPSRAGGDNKIFCYSAEDKSPVDGKPDLLWSNLTSVKQYYKGVVLSNIDNSSDGSLEIITCSDERGSISTYNADGTLRTNIPCTNTYSSIAVADIDGTGKKIIQASGQDINVWNYDGTNYKGTTSSLYHLTLSGYRFVGSVIVCDIDNSNDGKKEILTFAINSSSPFDIKLFAIKNDGTAMIGFDGTQPYTVYASCNWYQDLSVGDLNNDGFLEVVSFATDGIKVWNHNGQLTNTISYPVSCTNHPVGSTPILADIDSNHNDVEILFGSANKIYAFKHDGATPIGFPLRAKENNTCGIAVSDVDHDGKNEVVSVGDSYMDMWETNGIPSKIEWGSERHDQYNTGEYQTICEPTIINTNTIWNSSQGVCGDVIVKSGTLTINNSSDISIGSSSMIIVMSGASLVIDAANVLNANIRALTGSFVAIKNGGKIVLRSNAEFYTETGTNLEILYGSINK